MPKKILVFTPSLGIGGIERVMVNYANLLSRYGFEMMYLACYDNGVFDSLLSETVEYTCLKTNNLRRSILSIAKFIRKNKPDYIFTANAATVIVFIANLLAYNTAKIIGSQHNYLNSETKSWRDNLLNWIVFRFCYRVIAVSDGIEQLLKSKKIPSYKILKYYNPIDTQQLASMGEDVIEEAYIEDSILFVGRLSNVKNIPMLIEAVKKSGLEKNLILIGDGAEKDNIVKCISDYGMGEKVKLLGTRANPYPYIKRASLIALASFSEAYPTVLLESLFFGKTIVSTPTFGAKQILREGQLGYISRDFSSEEFAKTLMFASDNKLDENYLKSSFKEFYDMDKVLGPLIKFIKNDNK